MIQTIHQTFSRHDRQYCIFSVTGRDEEFLYYSHMSRPLRSLMFGRNFLGMLPRLMEKEDLCIECGLGLSVAGGVGLDGGDCIAWHCTVWGANRVLKELRNRLGDDGRWIELF
ncbi:MAG: hypothetical protein WCJ47_07455 [Methanomicrobiales archaeon]|jgi:hypothetical protein